VLTAVGAKSHVVQAWCECGGLWNGGFPGNTCRANYIRKILEQGVIARVPGGDFNPLNAELNPICCLLAFLGAHHFLHVNRIRVKSLTLTLIMLYIWSTHS